MPDARPPWNVFLSHTEELSNHPTESASYVAAAKRAVEAAGHRAITLMSPPKADPRPPAEVCRTAVRDADVHIVIAGFRYGSVVPGDRRKRSYTEFEFDEAGLAELPRLAFLLAENEFVEPGHDGPQQRFRERVRKAGKGRVVPTFADPPALHSAVLEALTNLANLKWEAGQAPPSPPSDSPVPLIPPPVPPERDRGGTGSKRPGARAGLRWGVPAVALLVAVLLLVVGLKSCNPTTNQVPVADPCLPVPGESAGGAPGEQNDRTLTIGSIVPKTGSLQYRGDQLVAAANLAISEIGPDGIDGVSTVTPLPPEDEGEPGPGACGAAAKLLAHGADVIVGPSSSSSSVSMVDRVTSAGGLLVSPSSTAPGLTNIGDRGLFFRTVPSDVMQGRLIADFAAVGGAPGPTDRPGARNGSPAVNVAVVARADEYGKGLSDEVTKELRGFGGRAVRELPYQPSASFPENTDFGPVVEDIRKNATDTVIVIGFDEISRLLRDLQAVGFTPAQGKRIYATDAFLRDSYPKEPPGNLGLVEGVQGTRPLIEDGFRQRFREAGIATRDFSFAPAAYDAAAVTVLAAAAARSGNPAAIASRINDVTRSGRKCYSVRECLPLLNKKPATDIDFDGWSGPLDFIGNGEPCQGYYATERYRNGSLERTGRYYGNYLCTGPLLSPRPAGGPVDGPP